MKRGLWITLIVGALASSGVNARAGDALLPPWNDPRDVPLPTWARSIVANKDEDGRPGDMRLFLQPSREAPRGLTAAGASLPFYGSKRGPGCSGRWWLVAPLSWTCSDDAQLSPQAPSNPGSSKGATRSYYFTRGDGAEAFVSLESALEGAPDHDLEGGSGVAIVEERDAGGGRWGRTSHGMWIAMKDLAPAQPSSFQGELVRDGHLDFGWVIVDRAAVWASPTGKGRPKGFRERFRRVEVVERSGTMIRIEPSSWMAAADIAQPTLAEPPVELTAGRGSGGGLGGGRGGGQWIDVDLSTQTLVAYQDSRPVYATLVSTGRGAVGSGSETPVGVHRVWVKIAASDMANSDLGDLEAHYMLEDVPYVQFFDGAVALHGTYWHRNFGHIRSHGCVNLAIADARWLFDFTAPRLPDGWVAIYPSPVDEATLVRIR